MNPFASLAADDWPLSQTVDSVRCRRLIRRRAFTDIVRSMLTQMKVLDAKVQPAPKRHPGHRFAARFGTDAVALDNFFNSASGYRAQYLQGPALGDEANRLVIDALIPSLSRALLEQHVSTELRALFEPSLSHPWAKVWIHQGPWLLWSRRDQRILLVPSWQTELQSPDKHRRKLARWGSLAPEHETRFVLKGGYVASGRHIEICKSASTRGQEIHTLGFT